MNTLLTSKSRFHSETIPRSSKPEDGRYQFKKLIPRTPLKFKNYKQPSREELDECKAALAKNYKSFTGVANWVCKSNPDGYTPSTSRACHADMGRLSDTQANHCIGTENAAKRSLGHDWKNLSLPFLTWFLYHSPYGDVILNRDDLEFCQNYGFLLSPNAPQPLFMNACIISRHFHETGQHSFQLFNELVDKGIDPFIVYDAVFNSTFASSGARDDWAQHPHRGYSGHRVCGGYSFNAKLNYYRGKPGRVPDILSKSMKSVGSIFGASELFMAEGDNAKSPPYGKQGPLTDWVFSNKEAKTALLESRKEKGKQVEYRPPNPFVYTPRLKTDVNMSNKIRFGELEVVLPIFQSQLEKELNNG